MYSIECRFCNVVEIFIMTCHGMETICCYPRLTQDLGNFYTLDQSLFYGGIKNEQNNFIKVAANFMARIQSSPKIKILYFARFPDCWLVCLSPKSF